MKPQKYSPRLPLWPQFDGTGKMADIDSEENLRIDEVEMGDVTTADGILAKEKQKFEYIHGHVEHQELHVPPLNELCRGMYLTQGAI